MKIELKRIEYSARMSEETNCFTADLYIDGKKAGVAENRGRGGSTDYYHNNEEGRELIKKAEVYCESLPPKQYPAAYGAEAFSSDMDLEMMIDDLLEKHLNERERIKFNNKLEKKMEKGVVFGIPGDESFTSITYDTTLKELLSSPLGTTKFVALLANKVLPELKDGVMILNTNIPAEVIRRVGLNEGQYVKQVDTPAAKETPKPQKKPGKKL